MKYIKHLLFSLIGAALGISLFLLIQLYRESRIQYGIHVDDNLKEICESIPLPEKFIFISQSFGQTKNIQSVMHINLRRFYGNFSSYQQQEQILNGYRFLLDSQVFFPILQTDQYGMKSVKFFSENELPDQQEVLPFDWNYVGEENYSLHSFDYAEVLFSTQIPTNHLNDITLWIKNTFEEKQKDFLPNKTVFVSAVGDIMVARGVDTALFSEKGVEKVFTTTLPILQKSDFLIGNLEGAVTTGNTQAIKTYTFKFNKKILPKLKEAGFDYLMLTNNHSFDYGQQGFIDTLNALKEHGIPTSGVGKNISEAKEFYRCKIGNLEASIISCGAFPVERSGFNGKRDAAATENRPGILWQSDEIFQLVQQEKKEGRFVIVNVHGGQEYEFKPSTAQKTFYQGLCNAGADIVFGSHPHVLQPVEWQNNSIIAYSLGNFVFPGMDEMPGGTDSMILRLGIYNGRILYKEIYNAKLQGTSVKLKPYNP